MLRRIQTTGSTSFLAGHRLPEIAFTDSSRLPAALRPVWTALQANAAESAVELARTALHENRLMSAEDRAGLLLGLAAAELRLGATESAWTHAGHSIDMHPSQQAAVRIQADILARRREYGQAYEAIESCRPVTHPAPWDAALDAAEREIAMAAMAWLLGSWETVAEHLTAAYPDGVAQMPDMLREDWFRLSLYRGLPDEAAAAATLLVAVRPVGPADEIMQTFVQAGWYDHALPLYRDAFGREPENELLRRRLVALYIKSGDLDEARRLTAPGALRTAA